MNALLVYPRFPVTYWGLQYGLRLIGKRATLPPLGLLTVAALLPGHWRVRLVDLNVDSPPVPKRPGRRRRLRVVDSMQANLPSQPMMVLPAPAGREHDV